MSKKKKQRNGFFYFMLDMQEDLREQGRFVPMRDMPVLAGPRWSQLPESQKQVYNQRAKHEKYYGSDGKSSGACASAPLPRPGRMDCTGELLSERRDLAAEMEERRRREREVIKASLPRGKDVILEKFYFVDVQSLCEIPDRVDVRFLPCELAAVEFSLHSGIHASLHKFIDPGSIPIGFRYLAQSSSDQTHKIPIESFDLAEKNYRHVLQELERFLNPQRLVELPPVFAKREHAERVEWCLHWLAEKAGVSNRLTRVYEVEALLCELSAHLDGKAPTFYNAEELLKTSAYDHEGGTRCGWHEQQEVKHCSLATVNIYCYVISDCLCPKYGIAVTKNHLPERPTGSICNVVPPPRQRAMPTLTMPPSPGASQYSTGSQSSMQYQMGQLSLGRGRGRGRGFAFGAVRQPRSVGGLQQNTFQD